MAMEVLPGRMSRTSGNTRAPPANGTRLMMVHRTSGQNRCTPCMCAKRKVSMVRAAEGDPIAGGSRCSMTLKKKKKRGKKHTYSNFACNHT